MGSFSFVAASSIFSEYVLLKSIHCKTLGLGFLVVSQRDHAVKGGSNREKDVELQCALVS